MRLELRKWSPEGGWQNHGPLVHSSQFQLVFVFGDRFHLADPQLFQQIRECYPQARLVLSSTSGNIYGTVVDEDSLVTTAIAFECESSVEICRINISEIKSSYLAGEHLAAKIPKEGLVHAFLLSDGHIVNGSELIKGVLGKIPIQVAVTGGLAGDGNRFEKTLVGVDEIPREGEIVLLGFYGKHLKFGFGSVGGWDPFGMERKITRSEGNVLYEIDGKPALDLYKKYLGEQVKALPSSALLFPLAIRPSKESYRIVRTILSIDEKNKSMIFAGDIPQGWYGQLMKANFDRLIDGAVQAAGYSSEMLGHIQPDLAILISCFGRRLVLGPRTEEEIESVQEIIGKKSVISGFYSYGEIAPTAPHADCELHNQTMTITTISERQ